MTNECIFFIIYVVSASLTLFVFLFDIKNELKDSDYAEVKITDVLFILVMSFFPLANSVTALIVTGILIHENADFSFINRHITKFFRKAFKIR